MLTPFLQALDPAQDVLIAFEQNHERLLPDHGFPVRTIIPGKHRAGGRQRQTPTHTQSHNHFRCPS